MGIKPMLCNRQSLRRWVAGAALGSAALTATCWARELSRRKEEEFYSAQTKAREMKDREDELRATKQVQESMLRVSQDVERKKALDKLLPELKAINNKYATRIDVEELLVVLDAIRKGTRVLRSSSTELHEPVYQAICSLCLAMEQSGDERILRVLYECLYYKELLWFQVSPLYHREPQVPVGEGLPNLTWRRQYERDLRADIELFAKGQLPLKELTKHVAAYHKQITPNPYDERLLWGHEMN